MRRLGLWSLCVAALLAGTACRDGSPDPDSGAGDGGPDAGLPPCVHVDGRGGASADGSAAAPYASIDDAIDAGAERVCLGAGTYAPPGAPIDRTIRIEGVTGDPERPDVTTIAGGAGECLSVVVGQPGANVNATAALVVGLSGHADLAHMRVQGCDIGVAVSGGSLSTQELVVDNVRAGVVGMSGGMLELHDDTLRPSISVGGTGLFPAGVFALGGATTSATGTLITGRDVSIGVAAYHAPLRLMGATIDGGLFGVLAVQEVGSSTLTEVGGGTVIRGLRPVRTGSIAEETAGSVFKGGRATLDGIRFEDTEGVCLQLGQMVDHTVLGDLAFEGCTDAAMAFLLTHAEVAGPIDLDVPAGAVGLIAREHFPDNPRREASVVRVTGDFRSVAAAGAFHVLAEGSEVHFESGSLDLSGGQTGLSALNGGSVEVSAGGRIHDLSPTTTGLAHAPAGLFVAGDGSSLNTVGLQVEVGTASPAFGLFAGDATTVDLSGGSFTGGMASLLATDTVALSADGVEISGAGVNGVSLFGATATLTGVRVHDGAGVGVLARDGATVTMDRAVISNNGGSGVEAQAGARLELRGSTFEANGGAAVAFYDAGGFVAGSMFSAGSALADFAGEMRADEVRIVSTDGASHDVYVGDDGDGVAMPDEENRFELEARAGCDAGGCTLLLGDGTGVNGIVRPNCIVGAAAGAAVHTMARQNGASMSVVGGGAGSAWVDALGGVGVDLGLSAGAPGAASAVPALGASPSVPVITTPL